MKHFQFIFLILGLFASQSQAQVATGNWRIHKNYHGAQEITIIDEKVFCRTFDGTFILNTSDNSLELISKVTGYSNDNVVKVVPNPSTKQAIVLYSDADIDIIENNKIINIPDVKLKQLTGLKQFYTAYCNESIAYIGTSFGIILLDLEKYEIKDTWNFLAPGKNTSVRDIEIFNGKVYAASDSGLYYADFTNNFLNDPSQWTKFDTNSSFPNEPVSQVEIFNNTLFARLGNKPYQLNDSIWVRNEKIDNTGLISIKATETSLYSVHNFGIKIYNAQYETIKEKFVNDLSNAFIQDGIIEKDSTFWFADFNYGIVQYRNNKISTFKPQGPVSTRYGDIRFIQNDLYVGTSTIADAQFHKDGLQVFKDESWIDYSRLSLPTMDTFVDVLAGVKSNNEALYLASYRRGLGIIENNSFKSFDKYNSNLKAPDADPSNTRIVDLAIDQKNKLYLVNNGTSRPIAVYNGNNQFTQYNFVGAFPNQNFANVQKILIDRYNQKWVTSINDGILVFDDNNGLKYKKLQLNVEAGGEFSNNPTCLAEDIDGNIWVGTDKGVYVYFNTFGIIDASNPAPSQIRVVENGLVQFLLESDYITSIAIDGGNRKWIGTQNGVWLFDKDDVTPIHNFNTTNSPLPSDKIIDIALHPQTGEVFFSTEKGLISYRGDASEGDPIQSNVKVFPNPVRPDYKGLITIQGFVGNAEIKITDAAGNMVYQTVGNGGTSTWNGKNFSGERAATGVYYVFITNEDGSTTKVEKIMLIN
jgi:hypothetical protein